ALDRAGRPAEPPSRLVLRQVLPVAQEQRQTIGFRQPLDLFIERSQQFASGQIGKWIGRRRGGRARFVSLPPAARPLCLERDMPGCAKQPCRQSLGSGNASAAASEYEKHGLKRVLGRISIA